MVLLTKRTKGTAELGTPVVTDSPLTLQKMKAKILDPAGVIYSDSNSTVQIKGGVQKVLLNVVNNGYAPNKLQVKAGVPVELTLQTKDAYTCASDFVFPEFGLRARLGPNDSQTLSFVPEKPGRYTFSCSMGMYSGILEVI